MATQAQKKVSRDLPNEVLIKFQKLEDQLAAYAGQAEEARRKLQDCRATLYKVQNDLVTIERQPRVQRSLRDSIVKNIEILESDVKSLDAHYCDIARKQASTVQLFKSCETFLRARGYRLTGEDPERVHAALGG